MPVLDPYHVTLLLTALITGVLSPVVVLLTKIVLNKKLKEKKCAIVRNLNIEDSITHKLEYILDYSGADRVWIAEFHNGGHTFTGRSMQKFSETYEVVKKGISQEGINTQNLPTSLFCTFFKKVSEDGVFIVEDIDSFPLMKSFLENRGVKTFSSVVIKNLENQTIGVIGLDKITDSKPIEKEILDRVKHDVNVISGYLDNFINNVK
jgi:hypothetical protein